MHLVGVGQHELGLVVAQVFEGSDAELVEGRAKLLKKMQMEEFKDYSEESFK